MRVRLVQETGWTLDEVKRVMEREPLFIAEFWGVVDGQQKASKR